MSIGRDLQSAIFRKGLFGRRPVVPTEPAALAAAAEKAMSDEAWAYVAGGAGQHRTVAANTAAFDHFRLVPRMLADVETRDLSTSLFGVEMPAPLMIGPVGVLELAHPRAEHEVAAAARATGIPMVISTQASVPMEEVAADLGATPRLYQLYWSKDESIVESFVHRAEAIGADALVVTLDTHMLGWRTKDLDLGYLPFARGLGIAQYTSDPAFRALVEKRIADKSGTSVRPGLREIPSALSAVASMAQHHPGKLVDNLRSGHARAAVETFLDVFSRSDLTWDDLDRLREMTDLPIVLKGLQAPDDARRALDHGVDGIIVSNHGGRQVDGAIASIDALPGIVDEVDGRIPVLFDSGIRSGADILKALALGADAVLVGRPYVYGLALAGAEGVQAVLEHMIAELDLSLGLVGARSIREVGRDLLG